MSERQQSGLTRRSVLKRGAVGAFSLYALGLLSSCRQAEAPVGAASPTASASAHKLYAAKPGEEKAPIRGGTVRSFWQNVGATDPTTSTASFPNQTWGKVHLGNGMLRPRADYTDDQVWMPGNVEKWEVSKDNLTWTLHLRDDVYWHDIPPVNGRKFVAGDIGWTIDYHRKNGIYAYLWDAVDSWEAPDDKTLILRTKQPSALVYATLSTYYAFVLPREVKEKVDKGFNTSKGLIGTGPWMFVSEDKSKWTYKRHPKYWEKGVDGQALPYIDTFEVAIINDYSAQLAALRSRQFELWVQPGGDGIDAADLPSLKGSNPEMVFASENRPTHHRVEFNCSKPPFDNAKARVAVSKAIDRQAIIDTVFSGSGVWSSWVPAAVEGYTLSQERTREAFKFDPEGAKKLIAETGLDKTPFKLTGRSGGSWYQRYAEVAYQMLKDAGMNVTLDLVDRAKLYDKQLSGDFQAWLYVGVPSDPEPNAHLGALFESTSPRNLGRFKDAKFDEMIKAANAELDIPKRQKLMRDIQEYLLGLMPQAPLVTDTRWKILPPWLVNMPEPHWTFGYPRLERAWLDDTKRVR